jgi:hypothetical protein
MLNLIEVPSTATTSAFKPFSACNNTYQPTSPSPLLSQPFKLSHLTRAFQLPYLLNPSIHYPKINMTDFKPTIAFFGATGGCAANALALALKNGYKASARELHCRI